MFQHNFYAQKNVIRIETFNTFNRIFVDSLKEQGLKPYQIIDSIDCFGLVLLEVAITLKTRARAGMEMQEVYPVTCLLCLTWLQLAIRMKTPSQ